MDTDTVTAAGTGSTQEGMQHQGATWVIFIILMNWQARRAMLLLEDRARAVSPEWRTACPNERGAGTRFDAPHDKADGPMLCYAMLLLLPAEDLAHVPCRFFRVGACTGEDRGPPV